MTLPSTLSAFEKAVLAAQTADSKKAVNIRILEVDTVSCLADYFVVCSGESVTQVKAIRDAIRDTLKHKGETTLSDDRQPTPRWALLDFGDVVIHVFHQQERAFYGLEEFWSHAQELSSSTWLSETRQAS